MHVKEHRALIVKEKGLARCVWMRALSNVNVLIFSSGEFLRGRCGFLLSEDLSLMSIKHGQYIYSTSQTGGKY